jgi:Uma2 family endonuclease
MTARTVKKWWTYEDYAALPEDGKRYEIHDGELWEMTAPNITHQIVSGNLYVAVRAHVTAHRLGLLLYAPLDVVLSRGPRATVLQPDLLFIDEGRRGDVKLAGMFGAPTLAVEIFSPSTRAVDRGRKRGLYARYGVPYLWFVDPVAREIEALALRDGEYVEVARASGDQPVDLPPFRGLGLVPSSLWPDDLPAE